MFHYVACGLANVWLVNGFTQKESDGKLFFSVENPKELHKVIGFDLVKKNAALDGDEVRFLRTEMAMSRNSLAEMLGCSAEAIKKWESGENKIQKTSDAALRGLFIQFHHEQSGIREILETINHDERVAAAERRFAEDKAGHWAKSA